MKYTITVNYTNGDTTVYNYSDSDTAGLHLNLLDDKIKSGEVDSYQFEVVKITKSFMNYHSAESVDIDMITYDNDDEITYGAW